MVVNPPRGPQFDTVDRRPLAKLDAQRDLPHVWESSLASHFQRDPVMHDFGMNPLEVKLCSKTAVILGHVCLRWFEATHGCPALCFMVGVDYPRREATYALERRLKYCAELLFTTLEMACIHVHRQAAEEYDEDTKLCRLFSPPRSCAARS
ncbi:uncharacterized protein SCHCODRAFT_02685080 [Schizophyllum commune H4-8]|nr:uncharacterized protein SCHCODRAFT_02685080 [Schizophyllum commune H4-8]KAI5898962.1 hypothetical protein SCHCODRAFT_02685080 [Schizophyllum commune H4-8]